jgi:hypothetical protein
MICSTLGRVRAKEEEIGEEGTDLIHQDFGSGV